MDLEALLRVPYVDPDGGFDLSPDGKQIAFSWNASGQWEVYVVPLVPSATTARPARITGGPGAKFAPRWSPDGGRLAYVLDQEGEELYDIFVWDIATERHTNLTPDTPDAIQPNFSWSPDGRWIAFISDRSGRFDTYVMPATGGPARPSFSLTYPDWEVRWSPDGGWLAVVTEARGQDYGTYIVPAPTDDGEPAFDEPRTDELQNEKLACARPIAHEDGPICAKDARWSPDGEWITFSSDVHGYFNIGLYNVATGQIIWATEGAGDKGLPAWSPDGQRLAYVVNDGPSTALAVLELGAGTVSTYQVEAGVHYEPRFTLDGGQLLVVFDNPRRPCDLWLLSLVDGSFRQVTRSLPPEMEGASFTMPTEVRYSSLDGQSVPALLYRPQRREEPCPAVVTIHGGPTWLTQVTWDPLVQHMVSRGWVVLAPNYRGSTGYGREWQLANRFDLGGGDTQDVVAGADYLVREGIADPTRIAVTGTSWGGYLTMTSLTQYPDRWVAGSAVVPFLNWFTGHANSREDLQHWDLENFGDPEKNYDLWYERSPFFFLDRVTAPVQLIGGAHDVRCPASESTQAHDALVAQGKRCDLVLYRDEGHGFLKTENVVDAKKRRIDFLAWALESGAERRDSED